MRAAYPSSPQTCDSFCVCVVLPTKLATPAFNKNLNIQCETPEYLLHLIYCGWPAPHSLRRAPHLLLFHSINVFTFLWYLRASNSVPSSTNYETFTYFAIKCQNKEEIHTHKVRWNFVFCLPIYYSTETMRAIRQWMWRFVNSRKNTIAMVHLLCINHSPVCLSEWCVFSIDPYSCEYFESNQKVHWKGVPAERNRFTSPLSLGISSFFFLLLIVAGFLSFLAIHTRISLVINIHTQHMQKNTLRWRVSHKIGVARQPRWRTTTHKVPE